MAGTVEKDDGVLRPFPAGVFDGVGVDLRPPHRILVVAEAGVASVMQRAVRGQVLRKIAHPAVQADADHIIPNDGADPFPAAGMGQVEHIRLKRKHGQRIGFAVFVFDQIPHFFAVLEHRGAFHQETVVVAQKADILPVQFPDIVRQIRIHFPVVIPVPQQPCLVIEVFQPRPVFDPDAADLHAAVKRRLQLPLHRVHSASDTEVDAAVNPFRQPALAAAVFGYQREKVLHPVCPAENDPARHFAA